MTCYKAFGLVECIPANMSPLTFIVTIDYFFGMKGKISRGARLVVHF